MSREQYGVLKFVLFNVLILKGHSKFNNTRRFWGHIDMNSVLKIQSLVTGEKIAVLAQKMLPVGLSSLPAPEPLLPESSNEWETYLAHQGQWVLHGRSEQHSALY